MQLIEITRAPEVKAPDPGNQPTAQFSGFQNFVEFLAGRGAYDLSAYITLMYYRRVSVLFDGVDRISEEVSGIRPVIYDQKTEKYIEEHVLLNLLNRPNPMESGSRFIKAMAVYYLITGNEYLLMTGGSRRPPLELYHAIPSRVTILQNSQDGFAGAFRVANLTGASNFNRQEIKNRFRFINDDDTQELVHIREFNPGEGLDHLYGMSKLTPAYYEIEQWQQASLHNLSMLRNGASPSGVLSTALNLTDDQYTRLQKEMQQYYMGARNAGRPMIVEGGMEFNKMAFNNKEMEFGALKDSVRDMIYNILRIPLPLVSRAQMTMNNMDNSRFIFYDNAVLPLFKRLMDDLGDALLPRFNMDPARYRLSYVPDEIPSLAARHAQETKDLNDMDALTKNEIRARLGYGEVEGGDILYHPSTDIPLGMDLDTSNESATDEETQELNEEEPEDEDIDAGGESPSGKKALRTFIKIMKAKKNADGDRRYTDQEIATLAIKHGLVRRSKALGRRW